MKYYCTQHINTPIGCNPIRAIRAVSLEYTGSNVVVIPITTSQSFPLPPQFFTMIITFAAQYRQYSGSSKTNPTKKGALMAP
jgi:hypothetical protein